MRIDASPTETELITTNPAEAAKAKQQLAANEQEAQQKVAEATKPPQDVAPQATTQQQTPPPQSPELASTDGEVQLH